MPTSIPGAPLDPDEDLQSDPLHGQRKRQRLKERLAPGSSCKQEKAMSPEEEMSASLPAAMVAVARADDVERCIVVPANPAPDPTRVSLTVSTSVSGSLSPPGPDSTSVSAPKFLAARDRERHCLRRGSSDAAECASRVANAGNGSTSSRSCSDDEADDGVVHAIALTSGGSGGDGDEDVDNGEVCDGKDARSRLPANIPNPETADEPSAPFTPDVDDSCGTSDVEKFDGKIVYNPDGSAYIIEDSELSEEDASSLDLPHIIGDGCIVDGRGVSLPPQVQAFPQIANAFYVSRNATLYSTLYGSTTAYASTILQDKKIVPEVPIMHSYRVYTVRDKSGDNEDGKSESKTDNGGSRKVGERNECEIPACEENKRNEKYSSRDCSSVPVKPILMCFICKLSFGFAKSFVAHAMGDHNVVLLEDEKDILGHKNASAIIQCVGKDKEPLVSFLEPLNPLATGDLAGKRHTRDSCGAVVRPPPPSYTMSDAKSVAKGVLCTGQHVPKDQKLLFNSSVDDRPVDATVRDLAGARAASPGSLVDITSDSRDCADSIPSRNVAENNSRDHLEAEGLKVCSHQPQDIASSVEKSNVHNQHVPETPVSLPQNGSSSNNSSINNNNHNLNNSRVQSSVGSVMDLTRKSPLSANNGRSSSSPGTSPSPGSTLSPLLSAAAAAVAGAAAAAAAVSGAAVPSAPLPYPVPPPNFLTGTTIGVCPDHIGGRPSGAECAKCELILNSSRIGGVGGPLAGMHSRNSCKTLKCPKCNWHYKYQETLEIHMKEKHPETETSCIYCIAGQPHPRLARGETYTCGYKPYRCEVCNYSTTTKGNLSIHMQSDKHLNNMQELQNGGVPNSESAISGPGLNHPQHQTSPSAQHHSKGGLVSPNSGQGVLTHHSHPLSGATPNQKPKPTFRCDVCNYETNVARNLRIHMTSEKHTHNMMVLQQNVKHMQTLTALQHHHQQQSQHHPQPLSFESLLHFHPGLTLPGDKPPPHTEAALADMAYNQALLIQMMTGGQLPPHMPPELAPHVDMGLNPETMEPPPEPADPNPKHLFQCCVCNMFSTDSLEALSLHLSADRTKVREQEILAVVSGHYVCKLCSYKTNLKANFQLHCKTDKHLQRLQHANHVKEGGQRNEWKLKYLASPGGIQVRCHACDYYTNSAHKLQLHAAGPRHEASVMLFAHLREHENSAAQRAAAAAVADQHVQDARIYHCALCGFSARAKLPLLQHVRSIKHLQMEQLHQLQRRSEGKDLHTDIGEVFQVIVQLEGGPGSEQFGEADHDRKEAPLLPPTQSQTALPQQQQQQQQQQQHQQQQQSTGREAFAHEHHVTKEETKFEDYGEDGAEENAEEPPPSPSRPKAEHEDVGMGVEGPTHMCPFCNFSSNSEVRVQAHVLSQHSGSTTSPPGGASGRDFLCPLCQDNFRDRVMLERHVMQIHSVNSEGLQRLLLLVDQSHWLNSVGRAAPSAPQTVLPPPPPSSLPPTAPSHSQTTHFHRPQQQSSSGGGPSFSHTVTPTPTPAVVKSCVSNDLEGSAKSASELVTSEDRDDSARLVFSPSPDDSTDEENRCQTCFKLFRTIDELCMHQNESGHLELKQTPNGPGYLCWKKGCNQYFQTSHSLHMHFREIHARVGNTSSVLGQNIAVSEKHVYKYRCNQCSLAFKTMEKLQLHSQYHVIRDATKCIICGRSFRSVLALHKHVETAHSELSDEELTTYKQSLLNNPLLLAGLSGQVLDSSTNELLRKESLKIDSEEFVEGDEISSKDVPPGQDDCLGVNVGGDGENSDDSVVFKEQQFLEDYLNSQAIAEDSYNDPNRKYKCHRCKVAFTRQSYLTSHNKTLLHRKGEKLSYPMEKYLDPNRPYKCDVCKESFTQKNILLVHYNSVSHLHKLKRAMQEQQQNNTNKSNNAVNPSSSHSGPGTLALATCLGIVTPTTSKLNIMDEEDKKPYKCNICKVAYSQGSTLDIHMRSVLHQTRASKLQDLAFTGQIDLSRPLIEQPDHQKVQDQLKKTSHDNLESPNKIQPATSSANSSCGTAETPSICQSHHNNDQILTAPATNTILSENSTTPLLSSVGNSTSNSSTPTTNSTMVAKYSGNTSQVVASQSPQHQNQQHGMLSCQRCSALFVNQEQLNTHQKLYCLFSSPVPMFTPISSAVSVSSVGLAQQTRVSPQIINNTPPPAQEDHVTRISIPNKKSSQVYKHLLESFGFDLVMQFNENHQKRQRKDREEEEIALLQATPQVNEEPEEIFFRSEEENPPEEDLPEVSKSVCQHCKKEFSSVWVLKAHCEEVHRDLVPPEFLERYAQQFKTEYEKKSVISAVSSSSSPVVPVSTSSSNHPTSASVSSVTTTTTLQDAGCSAFKVSDDLKEDSQTKTVSQQLIQQQQQTDQSDIPSTTPSTPTTSSTPASSSESIPTTLTSSMTSSISAMGTNVVPNTVNVNANANANISISLAQQMNEMQAALNVMAASQLQQQLQQFNPMMMSMAGLSMGLPLGLNMNALAAMNLQPPLVPMMMPPPPFDPLGLAQAQNPLFSPQAAVAAASIDPLLAKQQHLIQQQQAVTAAQQKRARTRITDEQLKILRAHFDINNSPSEDQIHEMASQSGLPPKVIKHWFRNTLFKERQRNKDSPYNFNNPPSTTLNLEEYEKTGEAKVMLLNTPSDDRIGSKETHSPAPSDNCTTSPENKRKHSSPQPFLQTSQIKTEPVDTMMDTQEQKFNNVLSETEHDHKDIELIDQKPPPHTLHPPPSPVTSLAGSTCSNNDQNVGTSSPGSLTSIITSQLSANSLNSPNRVNATTPPSNNVLPSKLSPTSFASPSQVTNSSHAVSVSQSARSISPGRAFSTNSSDGFSHGLMPGSCGSGSNNNSSGSSSGKRANRTRFTDYQIKVLQEFFENNAYPKDDDLEYLSKLLSLSPRVIVVWFQNARQKARKVYENQPPVDASPGVDEGGANRFQRTPGLNYQCKKCLLVFQRYYELIRHQKTHCFKEEDAKRSAQAQAAAAQIAAVLSSEDSNSSTIVEGNQQQQTVGASPSSTPVQVPTQQLTPLTGSTTQAAPVHSTASQVTSAPSVTTLASSVPVTTTLATGTPRALFTASPTLPRSQDDSAKEGTFQCDKCNLVFPRFDLWREHQLVHIMNPNLFPSYPPDSPFGILQQHAQIQQQQFSNINVSDVHVNVANAPPLAHPLSNILPTSKRKYEDYDESNDRDSEHPKDKRLRTTILPEQLDYLYQKYQLESNPSRKMLENIAKEVGLKKRVVQVWFQNTRARERKGQFRAHAQVINKRCPFCPALFKVKSALESHLVTKHADQCTRGEINIDALPDEDGSIETSFNASQVVDSGKTSNLSVNSQSPSIINTLYPPFQTEVENTLIKKYYEESMKRYFNELQAHHAAQNGNVGNKEMLHLPTDLSMKIKQEPSTTLSDSSSIIGDAPLDLSKPVDLSRPMKLTMEMEPRAESGPLTDLSEKSIGCEDDSTSETTENMDGDESNPTSPASSTQSGQQRPLPPTGVKRFRTQMSSLQVKVMKSLFADYKTPTMAECEMLGREIGLPKRVVQVWFQNARAKEKKNKLALQKALGGPDAPVTLPDMRPPEECKLCQFRYSHKYSVQDHIFTKLHIDCVKTHIESGKVDLSGNTSDGSGSASGEFTVPPAPGTSLANASDCPAGTGNALSAHSPAPATSVSTLLNAGSGAGRAEVMGSATLPPASSSGSQSTPHQLTQFQALQIAAASALSLPNSLSVQSVNSAAASTSAGASPSVASVKDPPMASIVTGMCGSSNNMTNISSSNNNTTTTTTTTTSSSTSSNTTSSTSSNVSNKTVGGSSCGAGGSSGISAVLDAVGETGAVGSEGPVSASTGAGSGAASGAATGATTSAATGAAAGAATGVAAGAGTVKSPAPGGAPSSEDMALLHQLYGLGLAGFSGGVQGNMFLHPAMFSAAEKSV
ncbi:hypothetical protein R5R35_006879 [Gryllus longicercus]|uniref:Zinc finger homeobox protein 4 n=1 Tax=Gryllus longicercus TaxID=2509291 RepID=A0AAN9W0S7_9ORTH